MRPILTDEDLEKYSTEYRELIQKLLPIKITFAQYLSNRDRYFQMVDHLRHGHGLQKLGNVWRCV